MPSKRGQAYSYLGGGGERCESTRNHSCEAPIAPTRNGFPSKMKQDEGGKSSEDPREGPGGGSLARSGKLCAAGAILRLHVEPRVTAVKRPPISLQRTNKQGSLCPIEPAVLLG